MDRVKKHFEEEAEVFDKMVLERIPRYNEMLDALVSAMPFQKNAALKAVDLGCGTGKVAGNIKKIFPEAKITLVDFSENMLEMARRKFKAYKNMSFQQSDFKKYVFEEGLDAVVSSLALHHIGSKEERLDMYRRINNALKKGGVFYNADIILGASDYLVSLNMERWNEFMNTTIERREIKTTLQNYKHEDHPVKLEEHFELLEQAGFRDPDIIWKYYGAAVFGAVK